jgi:putative ABC transport system permease protein
MILSRLFPRALPLLGALFGRRRFERELDEELLFHMEMEIRNNVALGLDPREARYRAERAFGGVARVKEDVRSLRGLSVFDALAQDLRSAARAVRRSKGFSAVVVLTFALGVGANTAVFGVLDGVLLDPLPYGSTDRLVVLRQEAAAGETASSPLSLAFSVPEVEDYRRETRTLDALVEYHSMPFVLIGGNEPERVQTGVVSADFFDVLGVRPMAGRLFLPGEDSMGANPVLVLGYDYWQRRYRGDPSVVGRALRMNDGPHRIVGVLPPLPRFPGDDDVFMPISSCPFRSNAESRVSRDARMLSLIGRLGPGVSLAEAAADLARASERIRARNGDYYRALPSYRADIVPLSQEITRRARPVLLLLFATTVLVLLIACSNVFNLTLAQLSRRERELALRVALGADRRQVLRQLVSEATLLALAGGGIGLVFAWLGSGALQSLAARLCARAPEVRLDASLLAFTLTVSIGAGLLFGVVPGVLARRAISASRASRARGRTLLVVAQLAISLVLLSGAGLTLKSLYRLEQVDPGFETEHVLTMLIDLDWSRYHDDDTVREFQRALLERLSATPGVKGVALGRSFPLSERAGPMPKRLRLEGDPEQSEGQHALLDFHAVSADYFRTIGVTLREGRYFAARDVAGAPLVAIVNRAAAERYWPSESPLGKTVSPGGDRWYRIVGVVGDVRQYRLDTDAGASIYFALTQVPLRVTDLVVATATDPLEMVDAIKSTVHQLDPDQAVAFTSTLAEARRELIRAPLLTSTLLTTFAGLALLIALVGLSGSLALTVERRAHEIGIRIALGASRSRVFVQVMRQAAVILAGGLLLGVPAALATSTLLSSFLFQVRPHDPVTFSMVSLFLALASAAACAIPARRATSINPLESVRLEHG